MNNADSNKPHKSDDRKQRDGSLLESMMEPMDQLSKVAPENTQRKTSDDQNLS
ncbi:hypothetical protein [Bacillus sp. J33]|uniref:hypothetical protein n=1 Tax=Bacillus sp. J33 TaxID=935836 RepID=UPI0004B4C2E8|nr:hypothetical protein [Bacillus sp. J33]